MLFGNAYRLKPISDRDQPFTDKCLLSSKTSSTALVHTPDLFRVVHYVKESNDAAFAAQCRKLLVETVGLVEFPSTPRIEDESINIETAN